MKRIPPALYPVGRTILRKLNQAEAELLNPALLAVTKAILTKRIERCRTELKDIFDETPEKVAGLLRGGKDAL